MWNSFERVMGGSWFRRCRREFSGCGMVIKGTLLAAGMLLAGCAADTPWVYIARDKLETASKEYNKMIRWKEMDNACVTFAEEGDKEGCLKRALTLKDLQITDIRTRDIELGREGVEATVSTEIEYYLLPSTVVRIIQDRQSWRFLGSHETGEWRITNPLPKFASP